MQLINNQQPKHKMNEIEKYQEAKKTLNTFDSWAAMLGKEYFGGTRGKGGEFGQISDASGLLVIYYQEYDGDTNYHPMPVKVGGFCPVRSAFGKAMIALGPMLIDKTRELLEQEVATARRQCEELAREILAQENNQ